MAKAEGTQLAVISTEHTLTTITDAGSYVLSVDTSNLTGSDEVRIKVKTKIRSTSSSNVAYRSILIPSSTPNFYTIPIKSEHEYIVTLEQTAGTGRNFDWSVAEL